MGIELVADPTVLLLDEPTSGLDSSSSKALAESLRQLCSLGLTVIAVLHQPRYEIFEMFHKVLLLAKGGRTAYFGPTNKVTKKERKKNRRIMETQQFLGRTIL